MNLQHTQSRKKNSQVRTSNFSQVSLFNLFLTALESHALGTDRKVTEVVDSAYKTSVEHRRAFSGWCCSPLVSQHCRQLPPNNRLTIISPESTTFNQIQLSKEYSAAKLWGNLNFLWLRKFQNSGSSQLAWCVLFLQLNISGPWLHRNRWGRGGEGEPLTNTDAYIPPSEVLV